MTYRSEIDGLRALAVLSVIFFMTVSKLLAAGLLALRFFVISGYLITTILIGDLENNRFSRMKALASSNIN